MFISINSCETQEIIFGIVFTHFLENDKADKMGEDETGVDKMGVDEVEINHFLLAA